MYLSGAGDNAPYGVYVGPYYATVNGVADTPVICDDYSHDSYISESWMADLSTSSNMSDIRFDPANYDELALLANTLFGLNGPNNAEADALQYAIWYLDDPDFRSHSFFFPPRGRRRESAFMFFFGRV